MTQIINLYDHPAYWDWWAQQIRTVEDSSEIATGVLSNLGSIPFSRLNLEQRPEYVIELGCGDGAMLAGFQELGCDVMGLDSSEEAISRAKSLLGESSAFQLDFFNIEDARLKAEIAKADLIFMPYSVIQHATGPAQSALIEFLATSLKPSGILILDVSTVKGSDPHHRLVDVSSDGKWVFLNIEGDEITTHLLIPAIEGIVNFSAHKSRGMTLGITHFDKSSTTLLDKTLRRAFVNVITKYTKGTTTSGNELAYVLANWQAFDQDNPEHTRCTWVCGTALT